ncbi:MAG: TetR/AcrR family transcriptional regulator [Aminipila sp.]
MCSCKETKKQKILEAAYLLFSENGYKCTKISDIAAKAGIGKGTVYEYFESKESLLLSIVSSGVEAYLDKCKSVVESRATQTEKLLELIRIEDKQSEENGPRVVKMSQMILDTNDGMPNAFIKKMHKLWNQKYIFINQILVRGIENGEFKKMNTDMATVAIMGATEMYLNIKYGMCTISDVLLPFDAESFKRQELIEFILNGVQA